MSADDAAADRPQEPPGTAERVGYAIAYFILLGFSVGGAVRGVTGTLLFSPAVGATTAVGAVTTAGVAGLLSGLRHPPSTGRVLAFSFVAVLLQVALGALLVPSVGDLRGSLYVAADVGLTWLAALSFSWALVFGIDWSGARARLRAHLRGERDD
ncbi:hypothetical protein [Haloglomus litoreum]|uniref:hypothetical protein n=1 Tax=Haloglomus litoreum TaxID=3034026 RepID=UPI0023E7F8F0|nr:hypothetical protein [Haloglomus sp. DT116]